MGRRNAVGVLVCALGLLVLACGRPCESEPAESAASSSGQSYDQAILLMCEVDRRASISDDDPLEKSSRRYDYIVENVKNPDGIEYRTLWSVKPAPDQAKSLRAEAERVGIKSCALADHLARGD